MIYSLYIAWDAVKSPTLSRAWKKLWFDRLDSEKRNLDGQLATWNTETNNEGVQMLENTRQVAPDHYPVSERNQHDLEE